MNNTRNVMLALAIALGLAGCSKPAATPGPLAGAAIGAPFALTGQNGQVVRDTDFAGRYRIVYFGYTYCPDVCPVDVQNIAAGLKQFAGTSPALAAKVVPIFITVDPQRDTPAVLKSFVSAFDSKMVGLTGSAQAIASVAKGYGVYYAKEPPAPGGGYMVSHSRAAYLMGPDGKPIALLPVESSANQIALELGKWVR